MATLDHADEKDTINSSGKHTGTESDEEQASDVLKGTAPGDHQITADGVIHGIGDRQPTSDPADPLNWSWTKKHLVLLSILMPALLTDFGMTWGTTLFQAQAPTFNMSVAAVANSVSGGIFLQGPGGVFAAPFAQRYGRLPVLFWSQLLSCVVVIGASQASNYAGFTACRTIQGFVNTSPQVIGLSIVGDMFNFRERTTRINIWAFSFVLGPFFGPFISAFLLEKLEWRSIFGVLAGFYGFSLLILIVIGDETLYDHNPRPSGIGGRIALLTGVAGAKATGRPTLWSGYMHTISIGLRPQVLTVTAGFLMILFMWAIGIVTSISQFLLGPPYLFSGTAFALFYLGPMIGAILGEVWGHFQNEWLQNRYMRTHHGNHVPENRLYGTYIAFFFGFVGLVLFGETLQHSLNWIGLCLGWAFVAFGMVTGTTAVSAYLLDSFTKDAAAVSSVLNFWRTMGGFCVSYFQLKWITRNGAAVTFGCQAAILGVSFLTIIATQVWGKKWRNRFPPPEVKQAF
ncbi:MAG: hypothetical protein M4579_003397 [Chaenotheca gracillima]|nr:MAG: hypothetical protein M4579_003397 [Chaenotheca gracillima]